ncbi:MAG: protein-glutamine glutaminase family protein [Bdellovibrionales bacterium]
MANRRGLLLFCVFTLLGPVLAQARKTEEKCLTLAKEQAHDIFMQLQHVFKQMDLQEGETPCEAEKATIPRQDWAQIKRRLWSNPQFRNSNPNSECYARATLISRELDQLGFKSEKLHISGSRIAAPLRGPRGYVVYPYANHIANVVTLLDQDGVERKYVVDPMFTDDIMPIEEYVGSLSCRNSPMLDYEILSQTAEPQWIGESEEESDACAYSNVVLKGSEKLLRINQKVEKKVGGQRLYNTLADIKLPVLGKTRESAKAAFCSQKNDSL